MRCRSGIATISSGGTPLLGQGQTMFGDPLPLAANPRQGGLVGVGSEIRAGAVALRLRVGDSRPGSSAAGSPARSWPRSPPRSSGFSPSAIITRRSSACVTRPGSWSHGAAMATPSRHPAPARPLARRAGARDLDDDEQRHHEGGVNMLIIGTAFRRRRSCCSFRPAGSGPPAQARSPRPAAGVIFVLLSAPTVDYLPRRPQRIRTPYYDVPSGRLPAAAVSLHRVF